MNNQQPLTPEQLKKVKKARIILWLGIVAIIVIGLLIAVYFVFVREAVAPTVNNSVNSRTAIDASGWDTYINAQYGFRFKYPHDWTLAQTGDTCSIGGTCGGDDLANLSYDSTYHIFITYQGEKEIHQTLPEWLEQEKGQSENYGYELSYDRERGISIEGLEPGIYQGAVTVYFVNNNDVFAVEWFDSNKENKEVFKVFNEILLSLKFPVLGVVTDWQTVDFSADDLSFSLEIPENWEYFEQTTGLGERWALLSAYDEQGNNADQLTVSYYNDPAQNLSEWVEEHKQELIQGHEDINNEESDYTRSDRIVIDASMKNMFKEMHCFVGAGDKIYELHFVSEVDNWPSYQDIFNKACDTFAVTI